MGFYPAPPGPRRAWHKDGTLAFAYNNDNVVKQLSPAQMLGVNDESDTTVYDGLSKFPDFFNMNPRTFGLIFPYKIDLVGWFSVMTDISHPPTMTWATAPDTFNGLDGHWTDRSALGSGNTPGGALPGPTSPNYRSAILAVNLPGINGIKFSGNGFIGDGIGIYTLHIYGTPSAGQVLQQLQVVEGATTNYLSGTDEDYGDIARTSVGTKQCRIYNPRTLTAKNVMVSFSAPTDTTPTLISQFLVSDDGGTTYASSLNIGDIAPGGYSPVLTIKNVVDPNATVSLWTVLMSAIAMSWV
jgi:hypothetical protein